jgi:plasmid stabilization system protein ParE
MQISISDDAERDIENGYWFYEHQEPGVGDYFRSSISADIDSLIIHGGSHAVVDGYHRKICKTFPYNIYYEIPTEGNLLVVAVIGQHQNRKPKLNG